MKYLSGIHALNIEDSLNTCGDWHTSSLDWKNIVLRDSDDSPLGLRGIEVGKVILENAGVFNVANTLRAILDMLSDGKLGYLKGFRDDFICTDEYNGVFFDKVLLLKDSIFWKDICSLMKREFMSEWDNYKRLRNE